MNMRKNREVFITSDIWFNRPMGDFSSMKNEEYNNMITKKEGNTIYKTRYQFLEDNNLYAIDIFKGDFATEGS